MLRTPLAQLSNPIDSRMIYHWVFHQILQMNFQLVSMGRQPRCTSNKGLVYIQAGLSWHPSLFGSSKVKFGLGSDIVTVRTGKIINHKWIHASINNNNKKAISNKDYLSIIVILKAISVTLNCVAAIICFLKHYLLGINESTDCSR